MSVKATTFGPWIKGVDASTGVLTQPRGSVPRGSNLLLSKRGSLRTCDGSLLVNAYNGVATAGRGKAMCEFFFAPTGVAGYYLRVMKALDQHLSRPMNPTATAQAGGNLAPSQAYFYNVTAIDRTGGETTISAEATDTTTSSNKQIALVWNIVPNAVGYNVYRATTTGNEELMVGAGLPVPQPTAGNLTVTFVDDGTATEGLTVAVTSAVAISTAPVIVVNATFVFPDTSSIQVGTVFTYTAGTNSHFNGLWVVDSITSQTTVTAHIQTTLLAVGETTTGGTAVVFTDPPVVNTTQQTALYAMPAAANGINYTNANIVALFPADPPGQDLDGGAGGGGGGGGGGNRGGQGGQQGSTPAGGIPGNVSLIPQIVQFTGQAVIALGNGFAPQIYSDATGATVNPAKKVAISAISVDAFGVVTVTTTAHGINTTQGVGANVIISGVTNPLYNMVGPTIAIPGTTSVKVVNHGALFQAPSSGGFMTVTTIPVISNFVPAYPQWTTAVSYSVNSIIVPTVSNGHYYKAVQGGTSGGSQPTFPTGTGARVADGSVIWQEAGAINTAAPPPPGCSHVAVYAGSLWMFNTSPSNTANGLDGPTSLRMCDVNNPNSWNPINQAFLDKDDGQEGLGLATFTIAAQGIPPEGSLCAFKKRAVYQIIGVFGASNLSIQRAQTDLGILAPRSIQFVPGFGLMRLTYLGIAVFDGVNDRIVSTQVQPYLVGSNDPDLADIVSIDQQWQSISQSALTADPPMYCLGIPVGPPGTSGGALTRLLCFDLVLKAWSVVDLPFPISTMFGVVTVSTIAITLFGSFSDGTLQRWQCGDNTWATASAGVNTPDKVAWSMRTPTCSSKNSDERLFLRRAVVIGQQTAASPSSLVMENFNDGVSLGAQTLAMPSSGDFQVQGAGLSTGRRFYSNISGKGLVTIDAIGMHLEPRPIGCMAGAIA